MIDLSPDSLREFRLSLNLTQPEFAALLNTPTATYKNWEQGRTMPPRCLAVALEAIDTASPRKMVKELRQRVADLEADLTGACRDMRDD